MNETYDIFIGLEIHIHLDTQSKMFCSCPARGGDEPNTNICPVCLGYPGTLPRMNIKAMELGCRTAAALGCRLAERTSFARKNYFYPDMPKNYQISQFAEPLGTSGIIHADLGTREAPVRIHDVHIEEDAGKMIHAGDITLLDFNRAGFPLLEIVTEPDLRAAEEAEAFLRDFQRTVRYLGVSDANMEEGSMKCDANISLNRSGRGLGTKVEIKNMNSPRFVRLALNYEIERQSRLLDAGESPIQETRLWNENRDITESMRRKEAADDYRYFPEPDMPPFIPDAAFMERVRSGIVELPSARKKRLIAEYALSPEQAEFIHDDAYTADFFERTAALGAPPRGIAAWIASDVRRLLNRENLSLSESPLTPEHLAELLSLIDENVISGTIAKKVLERVFMDSMTPGQIVEAQGWAQIVDPRTIGDWARRVLAENPAVVRAVRSGDSKQRGWLMGRLMRLSEGRAAPRLAGRILDEKIAATESEH